MLRLAVLRRGRALPLLQLADDLEALPAGHRLNQVEEAALLAVVGALPPGVVPAGSPWLSHTSPPSRTSPPPASQAALKEVGRCQPSSERELSGVVRSIIVRTKCLRNAWRHGMSRRNAVSCEATINIGRLQ